MPFGMGVTNLKFVKGGRKLKKTNIAPFHKTWREIKSEKASKIRKISYLLCVGDEKRERYHNEEYADRFTNLIGMLETYYQEKSRMYQEGKSVSCQ